MPYGWLSFWFGDLADDEEAPKPPGVNKGVRRGITKSPKPKPRRRR